jgi:hypothetical protein
VAEQMQCGSANTCGCCSGIAVETPQPVFNRPGLSAIAYRVGTHQQFKDTLLARLHSSHQNALSALRTRADDDFTIALLDAFSVMGDVLAFYTERIANEAYLRTATERFSVRELAELVGYELRPGVAASTVLAFTVEETAAAFGTVIVAPTISQVIPQSAPTVIIPVGTQIQSIPGPGEKPQSYETIEQIEARGEWNAITPQLSKPQQILTNAKSVLLAGSQSTLKKGDTILLIAANGGKAVQRIFNVTVIPAPQGQQIPGVDLSTTEVDFVQITGAPKYNAVPPAGVLPPGNIGDVRANTPLTTGAIKQYILSKNWDATMLLALAKMQNWDISQLGTTINQALSQINNSQGRVLIFRQSANPFGYNAPLWDSLPFILRFSTSNGADLVPPAFGQSWEDYTLEHNQGVIVDLSSHYTTTGITTDGKSFTDGGLDGDGFAFSAKQLPRSLIYNDIPFILGPPDGHDAVGKSTLSLPANQFSKIALLAAAVNGNAPSATFVINYSDNTNETVKQGVSDWFTPQNYPGEEIAVATPYRNASNGTKDTGSTPFYLYAYVFTLNSSKIVKHITISNPQSKEGQVRVLAMTLLPSDTSPRSIYLDKTYPEIVPGSWISLHAHLSSGNDANLQAKVISNTEVPHSDFMLSAKVSLLVVDAGQPLNRFPLRKTTIYCQSENLPLAQVPITDDVSNQQIILDSAYLGLQAGRNIVISGERSDLDGVTVAEVRSVAEVTMLAGITVFKLDSSLDHSYKRATVNINANVAASTHGATVQETLGSGDGTQTFQSFTLKQSPLTYVSANTASGTQSTLQVRVNDLLWQEVPFFYGHGPDEHIYITREDDSGNTTVTFGDGVTGSRLPTGQQNVTAQYRQGIGLGGLVRANQLSIMAKRPLGVRGATNPQASNGAADPEQIDDARQNATLTIVALDRVVSLDDYQNFARAFAGIAKAFATWTWSGEQQIVLLTVAGVNGQPVPPGTAVYKNLLDSISHHSEPFVSLQLSSYDPIFFQIAGVVTVDAVHEVSKVSAAVEAALRSAFSFAQRSFGQPVHRSEVVATIQEVDGVEFVDLNAFYRSSDTSSLQDDIVAAVPRPGKNEFFAAQLLMLNPGPLGLEVKQ